MSHWISYLLSSRAMTSFQKVVASLINFLAQTPNREKLCRLLQYLAKYLGSRFQQSYDAHPHLRNQLSISIKKTDTIWATMALSRKILRFGPSITMAKTFVLNVIALIKRQNTESTAIFALRTLSALWIALFFLCDHYLWLFRMGVAKNEAIKNHCDYLSVVGWYLDCYTVLLRNILTYNELNHKEKQAQLQSLIIDSIRVVLDLPVAYSFLRPGTVSGKVVGACGTITSIIGLYQQWK